MSLAPARAAADLVGMAGIDSRLLPRAAIVAVVAILGLVVHGRPGGASAVSAPARAISAARERATFTFAPGVDPLNRNAVLRAVASADPAAQRLIARIDGLTTIAVGPAPTGAAGVTRGAGDHFDVLLDVGGTFQRLGQRGVDRLVLHELGHVVDFALVPAALEASLDAGTPPGLPCPAGTPIGACAPRAERFAESFAKWAMNDIGIDLYIGYAVPPPPDLAAWAAPLTRLAP